MTGERRKELVEILGAIVVVASLVFVGYEVRQNTIAARASAYQAIGIATASAFDSAAHDLDYLRLYKKSPEELTGIEWTQLAMKTTVFARLGETVLLQVEQGLLPPDAMDRLGYRGWSSFMQDPYTACTWPQIRPAVSDAFREFVEQAQDEATIDCSVFPNIPEYWL